MREVVYIVGAGLSKALERPGSTIPLMGDFLATMADHLENTVVQKAWADFQLQRALRWPICNEIQTFIDKVMHSKTSLTPLEVFEVGRLLKRLPTENIESLLSESPGMANRVSFVINAIFCDVEWKIEWTPLARFSHHFFETGFEDTHHLDGGPLGMHAGLKKRLWTIAHNHDPVFRPSPS